MKKTKEGLPDDYQLAASVHPAIMMQLVMKHGEELFADNGKLFFKWLDQHPEWKAS